MKNIFFALLLLTSTTVLGSDSLQVSLSASKLVKGDTLEFACTIPDYKALQLPSATLNVWIEDIAKTKRWKYRYPIINGEVQASLTVSDKIPDGRYAVTFLVQRGFLKMYGEVMEHNKKDTAITYMMITKNKKGTYFDNARVAADGSFRLKSTLFADSAFFIFSPAVKSKNNYLNIHIETPLDSFFMPVLQQTTFITVGNPLLLPSNQTDTTRYTFNIDPYADSTFLPNVTVTAKIKSKLQQYDEEYSRGAFQNNEAIVFDGLGKDDIARSSGILVFLQGKIPGMTIEKDADGIDIAKWRNEIAEIYLDEFRVDNISQTFIAPTEVAMIKVYRPPSYLSSFNGGAGAIAIYTKKGTFASNGNNRHSFIIKGYTNIESRWE